MQLEVLVSTSIDGKECKAGDVIAVSGPVADRAIMRGLAKPLTDPEDRPASIPLSPLEGAPGG